MKSVTISSPSKLHLSGEHAVVYGKPAVLVTTDRRLSVILTRIKNNPPAKALLRQMRVGGERITNQMRKNVIASPKGAAISTIEQFRKSDKYIDHICNVFEKHYKLSIINYQLTIKSDIPVGCGMGSSAALATALIGALSQFYKIPWNLSQINELAYKAEKFIHVNASGGDTSISCMGGLLWFRREFEFLKTFWSLPFKFSKYWSDFVLIDTGESESTGELVSMIGNKFQLNKNKYEKLFNEIEKNTKQMVLAIKLSDEKLFMQTVAQNQKLLENVGVVSKNTKKLIRQIENQKGAAKISGAGGIKTGSGIVIGYHKNPEIIKQIALNNGYNTFQVKLGGEGVKIEKVLI